MEYPSFYKITQTFDETAVSDVEGAVRAELARFEPPGTIQPNQTVAVGVGSRGVCDIDRLTETVVSYLKSLGLSPFVFPAMGSHGGATPEGQISVLAELGVTEERVGAPVRATMDVVSLGVVESGAEVFVAKDALEADHIVVINRVKPHTAFRGEVESGLCKMLAVGCGKHHGASNMHKYALGKTIVPAAKRIIETGKVLFGLAVVENAVHQIHTIRMAPAEDIPATDRELLQTAWRLFPKLPMEHLDILVVDEMGKNISGAGIDPNVTGFWRREGGERTPDIHVLIVLDLTPHSHGNAMGIGMVDLIPKRLKDKIDIHATYMNGLTSWVLRAAKLPMDLETDKLVIETALSKVPDFDNVRMARIVNTMTMDHLWVTGALISELEAKPKVTVDKNPLPMRFSETGVLLPFQR